MAEGQEIFEKQEQVDELIDLAWKKGREGNNIEYEKLTLQAWDLYPEPKAKWTEAYNTAKYIFHDYLYEKNYTEAKKWLNYMINDNNINHIF